MEFENKKPASLRFCSKFACLNSLIDSADIFILSRGMDLVLQVPKETIEWLKQKGKEVFVVQSEEAVKLYNKLINENKRVAAIIHSTC